MVLNSMIEGCQNRSRAKPNAIVMASAKATPTQREKLRLATAIFAVSHNHPLGFAPL